MRDTVYSDTGMSCQKAHLMHGAWDR